MYAPTGSSTMVFIKVIGMHGCDPSTFRFTNSCITVNTDDVSLRRSNTLYIRSQRVLYLHYVSDDL